MSPASATHDASAAPTEQVTRCRAAWSPSLSVTSLYVSPDGDRDHAGMGSMDVTIRTTTNERRLRIDQPLGEPTHPLGAAECLSIDHARDLIEASDAGSDAATLKCDPHRSALP